MSVIGVPDIKVSRTLHIAGRAIKWAMKVSYGRVNRLGSRSSFRMARFVPPCEFVGMDMGLQSWRLARVDAKLLVVCGVMGFWAMKMMVLMRMILAVTHPSGATETWEVVA